MTPVWVRRLRGLQCCSRARGAWSGPTVIGYPAILYCCFLQNARILRDCQSLDATVHSRLRRFIEQIPHLAVQTKEDTPKKPAQLQKNRKKPQNNEIKRKSKVKRGQQLRNDHEKSNSWAVFA